MDEGVKDFHPNLKWPWDVSDTFSHELSFLPYPSASGKSKCLNNMAIHGGLSVCFHFGGNMLILSFPIVA